MILKMLSTASAQCKKLLEKGFPVYSLLTHEDFREISQLPSTENRAICGFKADRSLQRTQKPWSHKMNEESTSPKKSIL